MSQIKAELTFLKTLVGLNLSSAMEYRASFISQILGMFINNGIYFVFWLIFFERFGNIRGYGIQQIYLLFAVVTLGYGLSFMFAGNNAHNMAYIIAQGRLDYYLVFPRNLLLHVIASRMQISTIGDVSFGIMAYLFTGLFRPIEILLFLVAVVLGALILTAFSIMAGSLAFFVGNSQYSSQQLYFAMLTFSLYPNSLFSGVSRVLLYTVIPAGFVGAVPVEMIQTHSWQLLLAMLGVAVLMWALATAVFYTGLRRYESGSAINVNV
jgi:ABC-2 type transport system permease protein